MEVVALNWMQVEKYLARDDRAILALGSTEQHAYLSLGVDTILSSKVAQSVGQACSVPVFPALPYGMTPSYAAYPGTVSLRPATYFALVGDVLDSLHGQGFRRFFLVNGHGGNSPIQAYLSEWLKDRPAAQVVMHNWWCAPRTLEYIRETDPVATHASWMENFPCTRVAGAEFPEMPKPAVDMARIKQLPPAAVRGMLGDGCYGGAYQKPDAVMEDVWKVAVDEAINAMTQAWV